MTEVIRIQSLQQIEDHLDGVKAVIFDMDDTLYGEKQYVKSGYSQVARVLGDRVAHAQQKLWQFFTEGKSAIDQLLLSENIYSEELKNACVAAYRNQMPQIALYDGVAELLETLKQQGYRLGMITDGRPEGQRAKIQALGLSRYMEHIIITDELGGVAYRKPNPLAFRMMAEHFGLEYAQMVYIGDNPRKDFIACEELGMRAVYFVNRDGLYSKE